MADLLLCYNKGCGHKYKPEDNKEGACQHHPGGPIFHDALKGWSCCKKRSTDFTEFLNIPGCSFGLHNNVKPPEPDKQAKVEDGDIVSTPQPVVIRPAQPSERPSENEKMIRLPASVADSLKQALEKALKEMKLEEANPINVEGKVAKGTSCKNKGCTSVYEGEESDSDTCVYHPGVPIFHEGMKYWSCCQRKTTDFNSFLSQGGCNTGEHVWIAKDGEEKKVACRLDWHQTGTHVTISVFAKMADPTKTWVEVNKVASKVNIVFEGGKSNFQKDIVLKGVIDPTKSSIKLLGTKVEINLKKLEPGSWSSLEFTLPPTQAPPSTAESSNQPDTI